MSQPAKADLRDRLIPWYFVAFFAVIFLVNVVMINLAVGTFSGQVREHPYEEGLAYNAVIAAKEKQEKRGWKSSLTYNDGALVFTLHDANKKPLQWQKATATFRRPAFEGADFTQQLSGERTRVQLPAAGLWEVQVDVTSGDDHYQTIQRIVIE